MQTILADNRKVFLLFLVIALLFFGNSIGNSYSFDDSYVTVTNFKEAGRKYVPNNAPVAMGFAGIPKIWRSRYGHGNGTAYDYRPMVNTVFAIEYALLGQSPKASHFINIVLYTCILFVLFLLLKKILAAYAFRESFAFLTCLLFASHPVHTEVVDSLKSRDELLALLFGLLATWQALKFIDTRRKMTLVWFSLFFLIAIFSKLSAVVFVLLIPLTAWFFTGTSRRNLLFFVLASLLLFCLQVLIRKYFVSEKEVRILYHFENPMATEHFTFFMRILFALKTLGVYIRLLLFPWPLRYYYGCAVITSDVSIADADVLIAIIFTVFAFLICYRLRMMAAWYGLLFFFISIAPVLNFIWPVAGIVGERLAFIPSVGFFLFLFSVAFSYYKRPPSHFEFLSLFRKPLIFFSLLMAIFLVYDWKRNGNWKDELTLFEHDAPYLEKSAGANSLLANKYAELLHKNAPGYSPAALVELCWKHYNFSIKADSSAYTAFNNAGSIAFTYMKKPELALEYFLRAVRIHPDYPQAYENIGDCYLQLGKKTEAAASFEKAVSQNAKQFRSYMQLASIRMEFGQFDQAAKVLRDAETNFPGNYSVIERLGTCYYLKGEKQKGLQLLENAYNIYPNNDLAKILANYFLEMGDHTKATMYEARSAN